ncbi:hypothetical protein GPJ56_010693 [Histomonas meleagridis]|uniref:uncharacterized protein n=1 Tax=Histomonas meleagridis TaxID=135588 RepID=UPI003559DBBD|nr:hypothetical protein GPJ56_010693 [Histomonas meleagridis]KAH0801025.1 hypothetical protein GO595_006060 [Histomonas meleagridis]
MSETVVKQDEHINSQENEKAKALDQKLLHFFNAAQGIWKDAFQSQERLAAAADKLQEDINMIKQLTALPMYPSGMKHLQICVDRIQNSKKRIIAIGNRLNKIEAILKTRQISQQKTQPPPENVQIENKSKEEMTENKETNNENEQKEAEDAAQNKENHSEDVLEDEKTEKDKNESTQ